MSHRRDPNWSRALLLLWTIAWLFIPINSFRLQKTSVLGWDSHSAISLRSTNTPAPPFQLSSSVEAEAEASAWTRCRPLNHNQLKWRIALPPDSPWYIQLQFSLASTWIKARMTSMSASNSARNTKPIPLPLEPSTLLELQVWVDKSSTCSSSTTTTTPTYTAATTATTTVDGSQQYCSKSSIRTNLENSIPTAIDLLDLICCFQTTRGSSRGQKIAKFGFSVKPGPPLPLSSETLQQFSCQYIGHKDVDATSATTALKYMWVDPLYRGHGIGTMGLSWVAYLQRQAGCDWMALVANDNGSGRLVEWYKKQGLVIAPELQDLFGSPDRMYGTTMVGSTTRLAYLVDTMYR